MYTISSCSDSLRREREEERELGDPLFYFQKMANGKLIIRIRWTKKLREKIHFWEVCVLRRASFARHSIELFAPRAKHVEWIIIIELNFKHTFSFAPLASGHTTHVTHNEHTKSVSADLHIRKIKIAVTVSCLLYGEHTKNRRWKDSQFSRFADSWCAMTMWWYVIVIMMNCHMHAAIWQNTRGRRRRSR